MKIQIMIQIAFTAVSIRLNANSIIYFSSLEFRGDLTDRYITMINNSFPERLFHNLQPYRDLTGNMSAHGVDKAHFVIVPIFVTGGGEEMTIEINVYTSMDVFNGDLSNSKSPEYFKTAFDSKFNLKRWLDSILSEVNEFARMDPASATIKSTVVHIKVNEPSGLVAINARFNIETATGLEEQLIEILKRHPSTSSIHLAFSDFNTSKSVLIINAFNTINDTKIVLRIYYKQGSIAQRAN